MDCFFDIWGEQKSIAPVAWFCIHWFTVLERIYFGFSTQKKITIATVARFCMNYSQSVDQIGNRWKVDYLSQRQPSILRLQQVEDRHGDGQISRRVQNILPSWNWIERMVKRKCVSARNRISTCVVSNFSFCRLPWPQIDRVDGRACRRSFEIESLTRSGDSGSFLCSKSSCKCGEKFLLLAFHSIRLRQRRRRWAGVRFSMWNLEIREGLEGSWLPSCLSPILVRLAEMVEMADDKGMHRRWTTMRGRTMELTNNGERSGGSGGLDSRSGARPTHGSCLR